MISGFIRRFWKGLWRGIAVLGLIVVLANAGISSSLAQVPEDTTRTDPTRGEQLQAPRPAAPDTLQPEALAPPFDPAERERPAADTGDSERAFVNADSLSTRDRQGERIQEMFGNVYVRQDTTRLYSEYAIRYLNSDELLFVEDVVIYERGDTLQADSVRYNRSTKVGRAWGNVRLTDGDVVVRAPRATYFGKEKRSVFPDSITLVDSSRVLRAREGIYWSDEKRAEFGGAVRLTDPNTYLEADSLTYFRDRERSIARGDVFIDRRGGEDATADTTTRTYLFGERADNREKDRYSRVETEAALVQVRMDSTGAPEDTLMVQAHRLEAFRTDTHRRLVAVDSVEIWQPDLSAVADSAVYDRVLGATSDTTEEAVVPIDTTRPPVDSIWASTRAGPTDPPPSGEQEASPEAAAAQDTTAEGEDQDPAVPADTTAPPPDSTAPPPESLADADTTVAPSDSTVQSDTTDVPPDSTVQSDTTRAPSSTADASVQWETPTVQSEENLPLEETRLYRSPDTWFEQAQVWGDSIRVRARNRSPDTVFVRGSSFAAQEDTTLDRIQQLKGRYITAFFRSDSLRRIVSRPNAEAIRFMAADDGSLSGAAQTSGDRIVLRLRDGSVKRISVLGGVQSTYYRTPEDIPDPFQLAGFQWTPERRPTPERLLQDERIRRRLDLDATQRPPVAQRASESSSLNSRSDSGRTSSQGGADSASVREADSSFEATVPETSSPTESSGTSPSPVPDSMAVDPASLLELPPLRETPVSSDTSDTNNDPDA